MRKILLIAVMVMMTIAGQAQSTGRETGAFTLQPKIGAGFGYVSGDWVKEPGEKKQVVAGIVLGVEGEYYAAKWLGIAAGVNYAMQGWKFNYVDSSVLTRLNYLNIPLTANIYIVKRLALKTGVQFGFLLNAKDRMDDVNTSRMVARNSVFPFPWEFPTSLITLCWMPAIISLSRKSLICHTIASAVT